MFRKKCKKCGEKTPKKNNFCANCGFDLSRNYNARDYGMIGKDDNGSIEKAPTGFNSIIGRIVREMNKQIQELNKEINPQNKPVQPEIRNSGINISITTSEDGEGRIKIQKFGDFDEVEEDDEDVFVNAEITDAKAREIAKLPKEEAKTNIRRLSDRILYEIHLPGVKTLEDIMINRLENSIEVKAFTDKKSYFKILPVTYAITRYKLLKSGKLILEMEGD